MITTDEGLAQTIALLGDRYSVLCSLCRETLLGNRQLFAASSETSLNAMRRLQDETDAYIEAMKPYFPELHQEADSSASLSVTGKDLEAIRAERRIGTDAGLAQTIELIGNMHRILCSLQEDTLPKSRQWFAIMSEGPLDYMRDLEDEARDYIGTMKSSSLEIDEEAANGASPSATGEEAKAPRHQEREHAA